MTVRFEGKFTFNSLSGEYEIDDRDSLTHLEEGEDPHKDFSGTIVPDTHALIERVAFTPGDSEDIADQIESIPHLVRSFSDTFGADATETFGWQVSPEKIIVQVSIYSDLAKT